MSTGMAGFSIADAFATFPRHSKLENALALAAGALTFTGTGMANAPLGDPVTALIASFATGAYYGILYARAVGGPIWNLVLPGIVAALVLATPTIPPGSDTLSEWLAPLGAYLTVVLVMALWHRHLGDSRETWAATNFPAPYRDLLRVTDT